MSQASTAKQDGSGRVPPAESEWLVVRPPARLDALAAQELRPQLARLVRAGVNRLAVDLSHVTFADSAGLACLVQVMKALRAAQGELLLVRPRDDAAWGVFRLTKFDEVFAHGTELPVPHRILP